MYSIMHISDLHRSADDPVSNTELIGSLMRDRDRYVEEGPSIRPPDAIVVSGDVIQGVGLGQPNAAQLIGEQYAVADAFLAELADRFIGGDRNRIVIVPGNHDVDWNTARNAMAIVPREEWPPHLSRALAAGASRYRWVLDQQALYTIDDPVLYEGRFSRFHAFLDEFYKGCSPPVMTSPTDYVRYFELMDGRMGVAGFNSCEANDCFSFRGSIPRDAVANSHLQMLDSGRVYGLRIGVWHHNIDGPPQASDYMDVDLVRRMIGMGFRLGLHGHQHRASACVQEIRLPNSETMTVVSAGSLCAGPRELPIGVNRQYNIVEIRDDLCGARVHLREIAGAMNFAPRRLVDFGGDSYVDFTWEPVANAAGQVVDDGRRRMNADILAAEAAYHGHRYEEVVEMLVGHHEALPPFGRSLLVNSAFESRMYDDVVHLIGSPRSADELLKLVRALTELGRLSEAERALQEFADEVRLPDPTRRDIGEWMETRKKLG